MPPALRLRYAIDSLNWTRHSQHFIFSHEYRSQLPDRSQLPTVLPDRSAVKHTYILWRCMLRDDFRFVQNVMLYRRHDSMELHTPSKTQPSQELEKTCTDKRQCSAPIKRCMPPPEVVCWFRNTIVLQIKGSQSKFARAPQNSFLSFLFSPVDWSTFLLFYHNSFFIKCV